MLHTSLGFHTFTIFQTITRIEANNLLNQFKEYSQKTGNIKIFLSKNKIDLMKEYCICYIKKEIGITWYIPFYNDVKFKCCQIRAVINPKILIGTNDYVTATTEKDLDRVLFEFQKNAMEVSKQLADMQRYCFHRIDYCINFDLEELGDYEPLFFMSLIQRSNIPNCFKEKKEYDTISHRKKGYIESFYLKSDSVTVNCYCKYLQLKKQFPTCSNIEQSQYIIRFEIQCSYKKVYNMIHRNKKYESFEQAFYDMLSNEQAQYIIEKYYKSIIMLGDYYTLKEAKKRVQSSCYSKKKKEYLIDVLTTIAKSRGVMKAKEKLSKKEKTKFNKALKELQKIGINPVVLPKRSKMNCIPNLLESYINS